jgi:hypothetical protein
MIANDGAEASKKGGFLGFGGVAVTRISYWRA